MGDNFVMFGMIVGGVIVGGIGLGYVMAKGRGFSTIIATAHSGFDS